jgi:hypothetical protein
MQQALKELIGVGLCCGIVGVTRLMEVSLSTFLWEEPPRRILHKLFHTMGRS